MQTKIKTLSFIICSLFFSAGVRAQSGFSGTVVDAATHEPLAGARVAAGAYEALTDEAGHFSCKAASLNMEVKVTRPGYTEGTASLRGDTLLNIRLYSTAFRPVMSSDAFTNATTELSLDDVLAGRLGGDVRTVRRSANAAVGSNLFIRGFNTLNATAQPLIVVDGTIWDTPFAIWRGEGGGAVSTLFEGYTENPLADIDVNDIESVQILKDASSIYGSKGANGAIIITTKQSHSYVTKINVDVSHGFNFKPKMYDMMNAADFRSYLSEVTKGASSAGSMATTYRTWMIVDPTSADYPTYHNNTDWTREVYHTGNTQHYGISIDGSDDVASYAITLGYTSNDATERSVDFDRLNARINGNINLLKGLKVGMRLMYSYLSRNLQDDGVVSNTSPTFLSLIKSPFLVPFAYTDDGTQLTNTLNDVDVLGVSNPNAIIANAKNTDKHYRFGLSIAPVWDICKMFSLDGRFSYQLVNTREHYFSPMTGVSAVKVDGNNWQNTVKDQSVSQNSIYADFNARFHNDFNLHHVEAQLGLRTMHSSLKSTYADGHNTGNDEVTNLNNSLSWRTLGGVDTDWSSVALIARASWTYDSRYTLWGVLNEEASSRFGKDAAGGIRALGGTWGTFPSIGAEWNFGSETSIDYQ